MRKRKRTADGIPVNLMFESTLFQASKPFWDEVIAAAVHLLDSMFVAGYARKEQRTLSRFCDAGPKGSRPTSIRKAMSSVVLSAQDASDHLFVNNIRHWSMFGIVLIHCATFATVFAPEIPTFAYMLIELAKFGTIGFFVISGFLLGERYQLGKVEYLKRRLKRLAVPWTLWFLVFCALRWISDLLHHRAPLVGFLGVIRWFVDNLFGSAFWFVPNLLVALCALLLFSKYIDDWRFGAAAFAISFAHGINVYGRWFPTPHTYAFLGFLSYLWLGAWSARNWQKVKFFSDSLPVWMLAPMAAVFWAFSMFETEVLVWMHRSDVSNTLRISNQAFSVVAILLLMKTPNIVWPRFINVREHTFGIYLAHTPMIMVVSAFLKRMPFARAGVIHSQAGTVGLVLLLFAFTYALSVAIAVTLSRFEKTRWMVGAAPLKNKQLPKQEAKLTDLVEVEI